MFRFRCCLVAVAFCVAGQAALPPPAEWKIPPVDGELEGELNPLLLGGAPKVKWKLTLKTEKPRERTIEFLVEGHGIRLRGDARVDPIGEGAWRIAEAEIDLGVWFGWMVPHVAPEFAAVSVQGMLTGSGEGTWRGGQVGGRAVLSLREGRIDDAPHLFLLEGISVDIEVADIAKRRTEPAQVFTWRSGRYDVVALGVGRIEGQLDGDRLRVTKAAIDIFGGELNVGSLVMSTARPEFSVVAQMTGVAVNQILFLLPPVLSEAQGRLDGNVALSRDSAGIKIGDGRLALREGETADLRLAIKPGWLTTSLPPDIVKYFPGFRKIENGEIPVRARELEITLTPLGDAQGRTGWVHIAGGPADPELTAPVDMNVNLRGPLEELLRIGAALGTDSRLRFRTAPR
jgi:hypothetical protein